MSLCVRQHGPQPFEQAGLVLNFFSCSCMAPEMPRSIMAKASRMRGSQGRFFSSSGKLRRGEGFITLILNINVLFYPHAGLLKVCESIDAHMVFGIICTSHDAGGHKGAMYFTAQYIRQFGAYE